MGDKVQLFVESFPKVDRGECWSFSLLGKTLDIQLGDEADLGPLTYEETRCAPLH